MANLNPISLETRWRYFPTDQFDPNYKNPEHNWSWGALPNLADWPRDILRRFGTMRFERAFYLEPITDVCVRYLLHIETAPAGTSVYVNGWEAGTVQPEKSFTADVTDFVTLDNNDLVLDVNTDGALQGVWLQPVPCESLPTS